MKAHIKSSLNRIKAEDELIEKTEKMLKYNYEKQSRKRTTFERLREMFSMRRPVMAAFAAALTLCVLSAGGFSYYKTPVAYVSLDINPSVELSVNKFNRIVSATAYNDDGKVILEEKEIFNSSVKDAISELVKAASQKGYVKKDGSTIILVTSETGDSVTALTLGQEAEQGAQDAIKSAGDVAVVYKDSINLDKRNEAQQLGISPGKLNLIQKLQALDPNVTVDQYKAAEVTTIMKQIVAANSTSSTPNAISDMQNIVSSVQQSTSNVSGNTGTNANVNNTISAVTTSSDTIRPKVTYINNAGINKFVVGFSEEVNLSALDAQNYMLNGVSLPSNADIYFTNSTKQEVEIDLLNGSVPLDGIYKLTVKALTDIAGNRVVTTYGDVTLKDNVPPLLEAAQVLGNSIVLRFSEDMGSSGYDDDIKAVLANYDIRCGTTKVVVGTNSAANAKLVTGDSSKIIITIAEIDGTGWSNEKTVKIKVLDSGDLTDTNGIKVEESSFITATK